MTISLNQIDTWQRQTLAQTKDAHAKYLYAHYNIIDRTVHFEVSHHRVTLCDPFSTKHGTIEEAIEKFNSI